MSGLELQAAPKKRRAEIPTVFLSGRGDIPMALRAARSGALDFLEVPFRDQALIDAVHAALAEDDARRRQQVERGRLALPPGRRWPQEGWCAAPARRTPGGARAGA